MNTRTRTATLAVSLAVAAPIVLAVAQPAFASGGPGGNGGGGNGGGQHGGWTCGPISTTTMPGIATQSAIKVGAAGTAVIKRDAVNDGLVVGTVTVASGWSKSVPTAAGPKVSVEFQQNRNKVELEAAQSALYYGPTVLVTEITTCTR